MMFNIIFIIIFILMMAVFLFPIGAANTKTKETRQLDTAQKHLAVKELAKLIRAKYAIAETAEKAARLVEKNLAAGRYNKINDAQLFAESITSDIQGLTGDKHFRMGLEPLPDPKPASTTPTKPVDADAERAAWLAKMRRDNYGFLKVDILPGNVGYLDYRRFQPPDLAGDTLVGVMAFLANVDALIIDLRHCRGGSPYMTSYLAAYFFSKATHLYDMEFRGDNYTDHFLDYSLSSWQTTSRYAAVHPDQWLHLFRCRSIRLPVQGTQTGHYYWRDYGWRSECGGCIKCGTVLPRFYAHGTSGRSGYGY